MSTFALAFIGTAFILVPILGSIAYVGVLDWRKRQVTKALDEHFMGKVVTIPDREVPF